MATILVTGAAGTLGQALVPLLICRGDTVRGIDIRATGKRNRAQLQSIRADIRDPETLKRVLDGVDAVVHAAAWHGVHLRDHPPSDFWELNADATFRLYDAAEAAGVRRFVLASTMGVYGASRAVGRDGRAVRIHEGLSLRPVNVYELSKVAAESVAESYGRHEPPVRSVALRFGMFVPEPFLHAGIRLLYAGVDERDVASAVVASLDRTVAGEAFSAFNVMSALPYDDADAQELRSDPIAVIRRHWPAAPALLAAAGVEPWGPINEWYDIGAARRNLGWRPRFGFSEFIDGLRKRQSSL